MFKRLVSVRLGRFTELNGVIPTTQVAYQKGVCTCHILQSALERGQEVRIVQIYLSATFDRVNHLGMLYKLCSVGIGRSVLSVLTQFLSSRSQHVMVDGCRSKLVKVVSGVPQESVLGPLLFILYASELLSVQENKTIGCPDNSTLIAVVPSPGVRVTVAELMNHDLGQVSEWCHLLGMKLSPSKTNIMIVSRSRNTHPSYPY